MNSDCPTSSLSDPSPGSDVIEYYSKESRVCIIRCTTLKGIVLTLRYPDIGTQLHPDLVPLKNKTCITVGVSKHGNL